MEDKGGIKFQDRIDDYILGRMTDAQRADFEREVNGDPEKLERLNFTRAVKQAITSRQEKLSIFEQMERQAQWEESMAAGHHEMAAACASSDDDMSVAAFASTETQRVACASASEPRVKPFKKAIRWGAGIAAVLLLGFFVYLPVFRVGTPAPDAYYDIRGGENDAAPCFEDALESPDCCEESCPADFPAEESPAYDYDVAPMPSSASSAHDVEHWPSESDQPRSVDRRREHARPDSVRDTLRHEVIEIIDIR